MKKIKFLLYSFLPFLVFLTNVSALSVTESSVGYGYTQEYNGVISSRTWVAYNSNNLVKYNYNLPNSSVIDIDTFNFRFRISDKFLKDNNYILTFTWFNDSDGFNLYYSRMIHDIYCYSSSWSSTSQSANNCFSNYNISYSTTSNIDIINVTLSFTPINDIYGIAFINEHDNNSYSNFPSEGWEITNINYQIVSSGTSEIIDNATQNTENIINNQNQNTQDIIDSNKSCTIIDKNDIFISDSLLNSDGSISSSTATNGVTNYIKIDSNSTITVLSYNQSTSTYLCFYDYNRNLISCLRNFDAILNTSLSIPSNAEFVRFTIRSNTNAPTFNLCKNGSQAITDSLTDNNVDGANSDASNFFGNFTTETYGLTSVITAPLSFIQSLTSKTCSPLVLPLPFVNRNLELPCMRGIYEQHFGSFLTLYQTITFGIISYWVIVRIFNLVKDFKNPDHDEIEVMDL